VTDQVAPTIELLSDMPTMHPDVLLEHGIQPLDYHEGLVFRSAIESIRGSYIASSTVSRQLLIRDVLEGLKRQGRIERFRQTSSSERYDFEVVMDRDARYFAAIEVKGGEGNSINISDRPVWASEFLVWCHLDGAIVNQPAHGAHSIINRVASELTKRQKHVDVVLFRDRLCGTQARPCPKYPGPGTSSGVPVAPDLFLLPQRVPSAHDLEPPLHTVDSLRLPRVILEQFGVPEEKYPEHTWQVRVVIVPDEGRKLRRRVEIWHRGQMIDESLSRPWVTS
jgi:hypothetical protein